MSEIQDEFAGWASSITNPLATIILFVLRRVKAGAAARLDGYGPAIWLQLGKLSAWRGGHSVQELASGSSRSVWIHRSLT